MLQLLNPLIYLKRNPGRSLPIAFVIMLSVTLVTGVVTIVHSIDLTIFTLYGYNRDLTGLTPRNSLAIPSSQIKKIKALPELGYLYPTHTYQLFIKTIFGKMPFPIFGLDVDGRLRILRRTGDRLIAGRMPLEGKPEAVISDAVAKNLGANIGSVIAKPDSQDDYAPTPIKLVGILHGPCWLGLTSKSMVDNYSPFTYTGYLAFAPQNSQEAARHLDSAIAKVINKGLVREWRFSGLVNETKSALSNLYLILNLVIVLIVFSIAFVCGLLANIYFVQRLPETAMLSAIGYSRSLLLARSLIETVALCMFGWILGLGLTAGLLEAVKVWLLTPRGLLLNPFDPGAISFTLPLPAAITLFAMITISIRLVTMDPVSIIERRG